MGQKIHPIGFRLGISMDWQAHWFPKYTWQYSFYAIQDQKIRNLVRKVCGQDGGVSRILVERSSSEAIITVNTSRPGIIIGRGGKRVDEMRTAIEKLIGSKVKINIQEIHQPDLDATVVGNSIAEQIERRVPYRRAVNATMQRTMQAGAEGIKVTVSGRLGGADIARSEKHLEGRVPLHTLRARIDFAVCEARTSYGVVGVKVWIHTGRAELIADEDLLQQAVTRPAFDSNN